MGDCDISKSHWVGIVVLHRVTGGPGGLNPFSISRVVPVCEVSELKSSCSVYIQVVVLMGGPLVSWG